MFERFTERARQVVVLAQDEARALGHDYIGTEHILLGLLREEEGLAARVLASIGIDIEEVRAQAVAARPRGEELATGQIPFTPSAKRVLELSLREALALGHNYIGTEHVLLGLVREPRGIAGRILESFGADGGIVRDGVVSAMGGSAPQPVRLERRPLELDDVDEWDEGPRAPRSAGDRTNVLPVVLSAVGFPLGLLLGWLIWG